MTLPQLNPLDSRLNVYTDQWADIRLKDRIDRPRYVKGTPGQVIVPLADLFRHRDEQTSIEAQLLLGQTVQVFDREDDMLLIQADHHGYVGWINKSEVSETVTRPTHRVIVPRSFVYPAADMKYARKSALSMGSLVRVAGSATTRGTDYALLESGEAVIADHIAPVEHRFEDYVSIAETLMHTPYLWGGDSAFGLDCSGLVQLCMLMTGRQVLRDSYMQAASIGTAIEPGPEFSSLKRGDLAFWKGHVGILQDNERLIHANGHTMMVSSEPLREAVARIAYLYDDPIGFRRP